MPKADGVGFKPSGVGGAKFAVEATVAGGAIVTFPSELCTDGGRAINNADPDWPKTLVGFAERAYEFFKTELQPQGYKLRAEILDFPGGKPGEVGITLSW